MKLQHNQQPYRTPQPYRSADHCGGGEEAKYATSYRRQRNVWKSVVLSSAAVLLCLRGILTLEDGLSRIQSCSLRVLKSNTNDLSFLHSAHPIKSEEFLNRRAVLARALHASSDAEAFIFEPSYFASLYYANFSQIDWEPWEPEERPLLGVVRPYRNTGKQNDITEATTTFLAPMFEEDRVRMLEIPTEAGAPLNVVTWEEHWDPYATLRDTVFDKRIGVKVMVDDEIREFLVRGLRNAGFQVLGLNTEVEASRQTKSAAEVSILRAVNTGTVEVVRAVRTCLIPGLRENDVRRNVDRTLLAIGFSPFFDIVLFDENAALPHGGVPGDKVLEHDTMVLIDVGAHYMGYSSDITRSFFIPRRSGLSPFPAVFRTLLNSAFGTSTSPDPEKASVWYTVLNAQSQSAELLRANRTAASVDVAARQWIDDAGYGRYFTHRVGHGIGIKAHESPYLHKGNNGTLLRPGMTFTSEPGIYLTGRFGVRIEDVYLVKEEGEPELLSGKRARGPHEP